MPPSHSPPRLSGIYLTESIPLCSNDSWTMTTLQALIISHVPMDRILRWEGTSHAFKETERRPARNSKLIIGVGRDIEGFGLHQDEILLMLSNDILSAERKLDVVLGARFHEAPASIQRAVSDIVFSHCSKSIDQYWSEVLNLAVGDEKERIEAASAILWDSENAPTQYHFEEEWHAHRIASMIARPQVDVTDTEPNSLWYGGRCLRSPSEEHQIAVPNPVQKSRK